MNRRRRLSLDMIRRLEAGTGIPASVLIQPYDLVKDSIRAEQQTSLGYAWTAIHPLRQIGG